MGQIVSEHRPLFTTVLGRVLAIILLIGLGIAAFVFRGALPASLSSTAYFQYIPFILFFIAVFQAFFTWKLLNQKVIVYENGLGDGRNTWTWEDITAYSARQINYRYMAVVPAGQSFHYTIVMGNRALTVDSTFNNAPEFGDYVLDKISRLPKQPARY